MIGQSGLDDEELYDRALRGEDISSVIGLGELQNLDGDRKKHKHHHKKAKMVNLDTTELDYQ
jgi:hypothetical protein